MAVLYGMPTIQYSARRGPLSDVYFLHSTMPSATCLRLSDVNVTCCVTYFQFPIQSAFLPYRSVKSTAAYVVNPIWDIGR